MNEHELCESLGIEPAKLAAWIDEGLPRRPDGDFDGEAVRQWLVEHGKATELRLVTSAVAVGQSYGVSDRTVYTWKSRGMPVEPDGSYNLDAIDRWLLDNDLGPHAARGDEPQDENGESRQQAETRRAIAEANLKEMKERQLRGELIDLDDVIRKFIHAATHTRAMLDQIPHRFMTGLIEKCPHCNERVYAEGDKRRILDVNIGHVDDAIEAIHSCLTKRAEESRKEEDENGESSRTD